MENLMFPMEFLRVTQKSGVGSHLGNRALDLGEKAHGGILYTSGSTQTANF